MIRNHFAVLILALALTPCAQAAESYDSCTGYISTLPATISTQGTWCLNKDLATSVTTGAAITVTVNNVTIDCNDFKLGGLAAGLGTTTTGISGTDLSNVTVRNCNIRGFYRGVYLFGSSAMAASGHIVEDNRFEANTYAGVFVDGAGSVVRRNLVIDTGLSTVSNDVQGIWTRHGTDVLDNAVVGVTSRAGSNDAVYGIYSSNSPGNVVSGNRVRGLAPDGSGAAHGIQMVFAVNSAAIGNVITGDGDEVGLFCTVNPARAKDNVISGFTTGISVCADAGGNDISL